MSTGWDEHQALASRSRAALVELLRTQGEPLGVEELAAGVALHVNTTREHLDRLVAAGLVTRAPERRTTRGRPRILYRYREQAGERVREVIGEVLVQGYGRSVVDPAAAALADGREAGVALADALGATAAPDVQTARAAVVAELDRLGFAPQVDGETVLLRHCPVEDLARSRTEVVCSVHRGLTQALVERVGHLEVVDGRSFAGPEGCTLRLVAAVPAPPSVPAPSAVPQTV